ncbi:MAG: glycosyltransferase family 2 protein [Myxococcaceae bacterium]|nr:glycosyltransferase family 2 protein [Myxococcaceae bacterium]
MKFSICIPNYNYEKYLGETIRSVLAQEAELEILVSDNASTDRSVEIVNGFADPRIKVRINQANVGFAGNLDRAARMASGDIINMLSSDDLMRPSALKTYAGLFEKIENDAIVTSSVDIIDPKSERTGAIGPDASLWTNADLVEGLPVHGARVYRVEAGELLRRCLVSQRNPFNFLATAYPRALYERVEGYGGGRTINPDKWFHWRLLGAASHAYYVDAPLFAYRWHPSNQTALQKASGALKYLVDDYVSSFEVDAKLLERAGLTREQVERAFVEHDIARHGLATLAKGEADRARRILFFGLSAYPAHARRNWKLWALGGLAVLPGGAQVAKLMYARRKRDR